MPAHRRHKKETIAMKVNRDHRIRKWLLKLNRIFIEIELKEKRRNDGKEKGNGK